MRTNVGRVGNGGDWEAATIVRLHMVAEMQRVRLEVCPIQPTGYWDDRGTVAQTEVYDVIETYTLGKSICDEGEVRKGYGSKLTLEVSDNRGPSDTQDSDDQGKWRNPDS